MSDTFSGFTNSQAFPAQNISVTQPFKGWQNPNYAFAKRQAEVQRGLNQQVQVFNVTGLSNIALPRSTTLKLVKGEATIQLSFPYTFIQKPTFSYGWELGENQYAKTGAFPEGTAVVSKWATQLSGNAGLWIGATVICCVSGPPNLILTLHYSFVGSAMSNMPAAATGTGTAS